MVRKSRAIPASFICSCSSPAVTLRLRGMRRRSSSASRTVSWVSERLAMSAQRLAGEGGPQPHHGVGIERTVGEQLTFDVGLRCAADVRRYSFQEGGLGHAAILHAVKVVVVQVRAQRRKHGLDAPAALLAGV